MTNPLSGDESSTLNRLVTSGTARIIREKANLNATEFAARVGVAARTLRSWEEGQTPRQPYAARKYLKELRTASQSIVERVEAKRRQG